MAFCPNCRTEYMSSTRQCADCGATLVEAPPEGWRATPGADAMTPTQVAEVGNLVEVDLIESQLRAAGIPTARRPVRVALFVAAANRELARRVLQGKSAAGASETLGLSELHRIRLVCEGCEQATTVDLLAEPLPQQCRCGRYLDLAEAQGVLGQYAEVMRKMAEADFEIEIERPEGDDSER